MFTVATCHPAVILRANGGQSNAGNDQMQS